ncbi:MAG TPA: adenylate/guanylate cyclase domain-containing protein [Gaiella sp.]|jgi:class 3 adenylate cyclase/predicted ATPase|nr:adenylate/guanylate cyclase domain-containing protein [Gaiella sp.]
MAQADELRPVTVLFSDIVGSTALGERLAPEEVKALVGECVSRMSRAVEEYGGFVQAYAGDGICAYFGVPTAHEDDPERAARAALRILAVVGEYARDIEAAWGIADFNVRIGVNSGQAAVGTVGGADPQPVALGDATNVAARLQASAMPGTIVVGDATAQHLGTRFVLEPIGEISVRGRSKLVAASRLIAAADARPAPPGVLVGRDEEVSRLLAVMRELDSGRGRVMFLTGDAGIGKTRLLGELREMAGVDTTWLERHCPSYGGELLYWPFAEILRSWLGVHDGEAEIAVRTKARAKLGALLGPRLPDVLPALGRLLAVKLEPEQESRVRELSPEGLAAELHRAYRTWVEALAGQGPVALALEDVHFADRCTRELAEDLLDVTDRAPLLLVFTSRPDPSSEGSRLRLRVLADYSHRADEVALTPLRESSALAYLRVLMPGLDDSARQVIVERAEGNPLYLEELLGALVDGGGLERPQETWTLTVKAASLLPPALENLLVARIDRLPEGARRLAQVAAVVGRTFPVRILGRVADSDDVESDLAVLFRADVVRELRRYPELECSFRHGLLQEAVLSTMTAARLQELHGRVAAAIEELLAPALDEYLELVAHHYARSQDFPKALDYLERAGDKAAALDARDQAAELWRRARKVAARMGDEAAEQRLQERLVLLDAAPA